MARSASSRSPTGASWSPIRSIALNRSSRGQPESLSSLNPSADRPCGAMMQSVLIVDDEFGLADITAALLAEAGYDVALAINGKLALASLATRRVDIVITDLM